MTHPIPHIDDMHQLTSSQLMECFPDGNYSKEGFAKFLEMVNTSYIHSDEEREVNQRSEEINRSEFEAINNELTSKNEFLDSFNHGLAHDIKNHTTNLEGLIQMLFKYDDLNDRNMMKTIMSKLHLSINQMSSILRGFLYLSRAESQIDSQYTIINANELKQEIKLETSWLMEDFAHNIHFDFKLDKLFFSFHILRIILVNLISNSLKFSKPGVKAEIRVMLNHDANVVTIKVTDNGIGMDMNAPGNKLLSLFGKAENRNQKTVGFGIGLFIIKKILDRHNGKINIDSQVNVGTTIEINLEIN